MATKTGGQGGRPGPRLEGQAKGTGRAQYMHKMHLPGMLYGKIFPSTVAHGRNRSIDVSAAAALAGAYRGVTIDAVMRPAHSGRQITSSSTLSALSKCGTCRSNHSSRLRRQPTRG